MGVLPLIYYLLISWFCEEKRKEKAMPKDQVPFLKMIAYPVGVEDRGHGFQDCSKLESGELAIAYTLHFPYEF